MIVYDGLANFLVCDMVDARHAHDTAVSYHGVADNTHIDKQLIHMFVFSSLQAL